MKKPSEILSAYLAEIGARGGRVRSDRKAKAAKQNAQKGWEKRRKKNALAKRLGSV